MANKRMLVKEIIVRASIEDVWNAWTTEEGVKFISQKSNIELKRGGPYEWFLNTEADKNGRRGGEGSRVLAFLPLEILASSWTFPPSVPELRDANQTTQVIVRLQDQQDGTIAVQLTMHEWQDGKAWDEGWAYFDKAWETVLLKLKKHLEV